VLAFRTQFAQEEREVGDEAQAMLGGVDRDGVGQPELGKFILADITVETWLRPR